MPLLPSPEHAPVLARIAAGLLGLLLLLRGARLYRLAVVAPGVLAGAALAVAGAGALGLGPVPTVVAVVVVAIVAGGLCALVEKLAVALAGVVVGVGVAQAVAPLVVASPPWWAAVLGGLVGLVAFPALWRAVLPLITAALGALALTWAVDLHSSILALGVATGLGAVVQWATAAKDDDKKA